MVCFLHDLFRSEGSSDFQFWRWLLVSNQLFWLNYAAFTGKFRVNGFLIVRAFYPGEWNESFSGMTFRGWGLVILTAFYQSNNTGTG